MHPADARSQRSYPGRIDTYGRWLRGGPRWQRSDAATTPGAGMNRRFGHSYWSDKTGQGHDSVVPACGETQAAQFSRWGLERRCIPPEPPPHRENWRFAALCVAFRSKYTRYSSLTRLVSRAPPRSRRSPGFHHRLVRVHGIWHLGISSRDRKGFGSASFGLAGAAAPTRMIPPDSRRRWPLRCNSPS